MLRVLTMSAVLLLASGGISWCSALCPTGCVCSRNDSAAECHNVGLKTPPPGCWPNISEIILDDNAIGSLELDYLLGFSNLRQLIMNANPIEELDLNVFTTVKHLKVFYCNNCKIERITPLSSGTQQSTLSTFSIEENHLTTLPDLSGLTNLLSLSLRGNPIILPGDRPFLTSNALLYLDVSNTDASKLTKQTLSKLPNLQILYMSAANIANVSDTFASIQNLTDLDVSGNNIKVIGKDFLSEKQGVEYIDLSDTQLENVDTSGLKGMKSESTIYIRNCPLACDCKYEALYWWAQFKEVNIYAHCGNNPPCGFIEEQKIKNYINAH